MKRRRLVLTGKVERMEPKPEDPKADPEYVAMLRLQTHLVRLSNRPLTSYTLEH